MNCIWLLLILFCCGNNGCGNNNCNARFGARRCNCSNCGNCSNSRQNNRRTGNDMVDCGCESVCETVCDAVRDVARDTAREVVRDTARDIARDNADDGCTKCRNFQYNTNYPVLNSCDQ